MADPTPDNAAWADDGDSFDFVQYWAIVVKRFWLVLLIVVGATVIGTYYVSKKPRIYQASASIAIEREHANILEDVEPVWDYMYIQEYYETQYMLIRSSLIAEQVVERLGLASDVEFLGLSEITDEAALAEAIRNSNPVARVRGMVRVVPRDNSHFVDINVSGNNPQLVADVANAVAETYVEENQRQQLEATENALDWLSSQYDSYAAGLENAEDELLAFLRERGTLSVSLGDRENLTGQLLGALSSQLAEAQLEADRLQSIVRQIDDLRDSDDLLEANIFAVVDNPLIQSLKQQLAGLEMELAQLSQRYLEDHPDFRSVELQIELTRGSLDREISNVLASYEQRYETAALLVSRLRSRFGQTETDALDQASSAVQYHRLEREAASMRTMFDMIETRLKEVELAQMMQSNNVRSVETANVPGSPIRPNVQAGIATSVFLGLALALMLVVLLEIADNTIKTQDELERKYGLTFLGMIPTIKPSRSKSGTQRGPGRGDDYNPDTFVNDFPKSSVAESCRSIRTNLLFLGTEKPLHSLSVTSAGPREGKTTTVVSLGTVIAQSGNRVLLIDTDMRRPRLHRAFDTHSRVGLSSLLVGEASFEECIQETEIPGVFLLPCGPIPPNPTELMLSPRFKSLVADLGERYDNIIFDSPPVGPVTDASILASFVDGMIVVVKAAQTKKQALKQTIERLDSVRANIVGAILNDVDIEDRKFGYYYYYYQRYGEYYGDDEEEEAVST